MPVKIITDSASNLGNDLLDKYSIAMVSMKYRKGENVYPCFDPSRSYEEQGKEFYDALRKGEDIKTSLASPNDYYEVFKTYLEQGFDIFYTSISGRLSGTINSANAAKDLLADEFPDRKIACLDSLSASFGEGIIAMRASELAKEGKNLDEIVAEVSKIRLNIRNEFTVDDLVYLKTGGRIQSIIYNVANLFEIKPMLRASKEATIELSGKTMGRKRSLIRLAQTVKETILEPEKQTLYLAHCDAKEDADFLAATIRKMVPNLKDIYLSMYDFCTGAHVGPGAIAIFYYGAERK